MRNTEVLGLYLDTLGEMNRIRKRSFKGEWRDQVNSGGGIIPCEAIYCYLLGIDVFPNGKERILQILSEEELKKTFIDVTSYYLDNGFLGIPYFSPDIDGEKWEFIDAACFYVSAALLFKKHILLSKKQLSQVDTMLERALNFIRDSFILDKGWSWGTFDKPNEAFLYSTWTVIETISSIDWEYVPKEIESIREELLQQMQNVKKYYVYRYLDSPEIVEKKEDGDCQFDLLEGEIGWGKKDSYLQYNLWILISLMLTGYKNETKIEEALKIIIDEYHREKDWYHSTPVNFYFSYGQDDNRITPAFKDRSFLPLLFKTISIWFNLFPEKKNIEKYKIFSEEIYEALLSNRSAGVEQLEFVWDKYAESKSGYAIYVTERSLEALAKFYSVIEHEAPEDNSSSSSSDLKEYLTKVAEELTMKILEEVQSQVQKSTDHSYLRLKKEIQRIDTKYDDITNSIVSAAKTAKHTDEFKGSRDLVAKAKADGEAKAKKE